MRGMLLELLRIAWEIAAAGFLAAALIAIVGQPRDEDYSCAPADEEDGEDVPEDPDRERDWRIADDMGVM